VGLVGESLADPIGKAAWRDACLQVPGDPATRYRNVLTGEELQPESRGGKAVLPLSAVFATFPVALLRSI
jgi:maltooligosyltrehalose synthase